MRFKLLVQCFCTIFLPLAFSWNDKSVKACTILSLYSLRSISLLQPSNLGFRNHLCNLVWTFLTIVRYDLRSLGVQGGLSRMIKAWQLIAFSAKETVPLLQSATLSKDWSHAIWLMTSVWNMRPLVQAFAHLLLSRKCQISKDISNYMTWKLSPV